MRILILDDMHDIRKLLMDILQGPEVRFNEAQTCEEAIRILSENTFDWAILDNGLPDGQGIEVLRHITETYPHIKSVMFTADIHIRAEAQELGALHVFTKTKGIEQIRDFIEGGRHG